MIEGQISRGLVICSGGDFCALEERDRKVKW